MAANLELCIHHVGGRGGVAGAFPLPDRFMKDSRIVFYDADPACAEAMNIGSYATVLPLCIGKSAGRETFHITHKPHASSLLRLNRKYEGAYIPRIPYDNIYGMVMKEVRQIELDVDALDSIVLSGKHGVAAPDVLSLDTEGTEYDVLEGAAGLLDHEVICVISEVWFQPIREGQKLFGDVVNRLSRHGFLPTQVVHSGRELSLYRRPVGLRGHGFQVMADAVFLKDIDALEEKHQGPALAVKLRKLAMAALVFGQLEYALECLQRARKIGLPPTSSNVPSYWSFVSALEAEAEKVKACYYPTYGDFYPQATERSADQSKNLPPREPPILPKSRGWKDGIKLLLSSMPRVYASAQSAFALFRTVISETNWAFRRLCARSSPFEVFLAANGFSELGNDVRLLRLKQERWCRNWEERAALYRLAEAQDSSSPPGRKSL